jgi:hypothetical protein
VLEIVQEIGAVSGLAGIAGLTALSALSFSQARDIKRLRKWAVAYRRRIENHIRAGNPTRP